MQRLMTNWFALISLGQLLFTQASDEEQALLVTLFRGYQPLIRPSVNDSAIKIYMGLQLVLLINVDERNQIMHSNVWLTMTWHDMQMRWNPQDYGGTDVIRVPPDKVWGPDIVLFNNADGNFEVSYYSNVVVSFDGSMLWVPPAIYKSTCIIDVEHFPFDEQTCVMNFGSWTFDKHEVELDFKDGTKALDLSEYYPSSIWDVTECPAFKTSSRNRFEYHLVIRRKTLFYTVVLIIPTVLMALLSMMVFYLPTAAGEKITLAISILLSLVVFLLLVSKILPATSSTIPLIAKYLLLTFVLNVITILVTVIILNVYFRGPTTHRMPKWVRTVFLEMFARLLLMRRPERALPAHAFGEHERNGSVCSEPRANARAVLKATMMQNSSCNSTPRLAGARRHSPVINVRIVEPQTPADAVSPIDEFDTYYVALNPQAYRAMEAIEYITEHLKQDEFYKKIKEDWRFVAMVIDRLLLYVFFGVTLGGTLGILLSAPNIFDYRSQKDIIEKLLVKYGLLKA